MPKFFMLCALSLMLCAGISGCKTIQSAGGSMASSSIQSLISSLGSSDKDKKQGAMSQLVQMGVKAVPPLLQALKGDNPEVKKGALETLGKMGPKAKDAAPQVKKITESKDPTMKSLAQDTLNKITK